jgi:hypothetical protein
VDGRPAGQTPPLSSPSCACCFPLSHPGKSSLNLFVCDDGLHVISGLISRLQVLLPVCLLGCLILVRFLVHWYRQVPVTQELN